MSMMCIQAADNDSLRSVFKDEQDELELEDEDKDEPQQPHSIPIEELISDGREILVQVMKEPIGIKGRAYFLLYIPARPLSGVSAGYR